MTGALCSVPPLFHHFLGLSCYPLAAAARTAAGSTRTPSTAAGAAAVVIVDTHGTPLQELLLPGIQGHRRRVPAERTGSVHRNRRWLSGFVGCKALAQKMAEGLGAQTATGAV